MGQLRVVLSFLDGDFGEKKIDVIFSHNDSMTLGLLDSFANYGINPADTIIISFDAGHRGFKHHRTAKRYDLFSDVADGDFQLVRADMRFGVVQNLVRRAVADEFLQHLALAVVLRTGVELSVGERTGAAFAETVVRFGIKPLVPVQQRDVLFPLADLLPPLVDNGLDAMLDER